MSFCAPALPRASGVSYPCSLHTAKFESKRFRINTKFGIGCRPILACSDRDASGSSPFVEEEEFEGKLATGVFPASLSAVPQYSCIQVRTAGGNVRMPFRISGSTLYQSVARLYKTAIIASDRARRMPVRDRCFAERVGSAESMDLVPPAAMYRRPPRRG